MDILSSFCRSSSFKCGVLRDRGEWGVVMSFFQRRGGFKYFTQSPDDTQRSIYESMGSEIAWTARVKVSFSYLGKMISKGNNKEEGLGLRIYAPPEDVWIEFLLLTQMCRPIEMRIPT